MLRRIPVLSPEVQRMTPLRQRFVEDLQVRNYAASTIESYTYHVACFAKFHGRSPEVPAEFDDAPRCPHCPTGRLVLLIEAFRPPLFDVLLRSGFLPARLASRYATPTPHPDTS